MVQSSANNRMFDVILFVMSLIYMRNRTGPSTLLCGTPDATSTLSDMVFSSATACVLLLRNDLIQFVLFPWIP
jgi:hypothetical protein